MSYNNLNLPTNTNKTSGRFGLLAKVVTFLWFASFAFGGLCACGIVYVIYHFISKLW